MTWRHSHPLADPIACCPWPLNQSLYNGNPVMYELILVLQYVNVSLIYGEVNVPLN